MSRTFVDDPEARYYLRFLVEVVARACKEISHAVSKGALGGVLGLFSHFAASALVIALAMLAAAGGTPRDFAILQVFLQTGIRIFKHQTAFWRDTQFLCRK